MHGVSRLKDGATCLRRWMHDGPGDPKGRRRWVAFQVAFVLVLGTLVLVVPNPLQAAEPTEKKMRVAVADQRDETCSLDSKECYGTRRNPKKGKGVKHWFIQRKYGKVPLTKRARHKVAIRRATHRKQLAREMTPACYSWYRATKRGNATAFQSHACQSTGNEWSNLWDRIDEPIKDFAVFCGGDALILKVTKANRAVWAATMTVCGGAVWYNTKRGNDRVTWAELQERLSPYETSADRRMNASSPGGREDLTR